MKFNPWAVIATPKSDILSRRADHNHPLDLSWGRDSLGRFLFIYEFSSLESIPEHLPTLNGIEVRVLTPEKNNTESPLLVLILKDAKDQEIFLSLCNDLITSTLPLEVGSKATRVIIRRLTRWQEFLRRARTDLLSEMEIKGLIGELIFITKHLSSAFGINQAIQFWLGPEGAPQDFNVEDSAIEVKCQLGATAPRVRISSAEQLCSQLPNTYLYVTTLGKCSPDASSAINLPILINKIREESSDIDEATIERFNDLLYQAGYMDLDDYYQFSYVLTNEEMYLINKGFPRICPEELPTGILKLEYDINLLDCKPYSGKPKWMVLP